MKPLRLRSIFLSDVHLGTPDCKSAYLLDFLRRSESDYLYLVGDIVDFEALSRRSHWPAEHSAIVGEILAKAESGTQVIYIPGNHDCAMRGLAGQRIGQVEVRLDALHVGADGRRFRVSHGDEYDPADHGPGWLHSIGDPAYRFMCWANRVLHRVRCRFGLDYLPLSAIAKSRIGPALNYIRRFEHTASAHAAALGLDGHICGHIHFGGIRTVNGVLYCNDGDWVEHCTALTEDADGRLELLHWSEQRITLVQDREEARTHWPAPSAAFASLAIAMGTLAPTGATLTGSTPMRQAMVSRPTG